MLAEHAGALQANRRAAGVVIRARSKSLGIVDVAVARIVMATHHEDAAGICRIGAAQHCIDVGDFRGFRNSRPRLLGKLVGLHLQASATLLGITFEFASDPLRRSSRTFSTGGGHVGRERLAGAEADQLLDGLLDALGRDIAQGRGDLRIRGCGGDAVRLLRKRATARTIVSIKTAIPFRIELRMNIGTPGTLGKLRRLLLDAAAKRF